MNSLAAVSVLLTVLAFVTACAAPKVGQSSAKLTIEGALKDPSIAIWRAAVTNQTRRLVEAGSPDLDVVRTRVCEQTAAEELNARKINQAWADYFGKTASSYAVEYSGADPALLKEMSANVEQITRDMLDREFTRSRDKLIEKVFAETLQGKATEK